MNQLLTEYEMITKKGNINKLSHIRAHYIMMTINLITGYNIFNRIGSKEYKISNILKFRNKWRESIKLRTSDEIGRILQLSIFMTAQQLTQNKNIKCKFMD